MADSKQLNDASVTPPAAPDPATQPQTGVSIDPAKAAGPQVNERMELPNVEQAAGPQSIELSHDYPKDGIRIDERIQDSEK